MRMPAAVDIRKHGRRDSEEEPRHAFFGIAALLFAVSAVVTVLWGTSMSAMAGMPMPGGWTMSMAWMPICGQTWSGTAASFLGMWIVMMMAMMLPSLMPMLLQYRRMTSSNIGVRRGRQTMLVGTGYFFVWTLFGMTVYPLGAALAEALMQLPVLARAAPVAAGLVVLLAGALQFSKWKARQLACCRKGAGAGCMMTAGSGAALRHGVRLGFRCGCCCANLMAVLLALGVMDLRAMAVVTAAITAERLAPAGERVARVTRVTGACTVGAGLLLIVQAGGLA